MATVNRSFLLVGCYTTETGGTGTGVTVMAEDGDGWSPIGGAGLVSPSWLTAHPRLPVVYAASETADGSVTALELAADGTLSVLGSSDSGSRETGGADPCHLAVSADGRFLLATNYSGGSVTVFGLDPGGRIGDRTERKRQVGTGPVADRQQAAHPHMVTFDGPDTVVVADLGADALFGYRLEPHGRLSALSRSLLPPGSGPRQLVRAGQHWLLAAELSAELMTLTGSAENGFTVTGSVPASGKAGPMFPAQLTPTADGALAVLSNRGPDTVAVFDVTGTAPLLISETDVGPGWPRHFCLIGDELLVALQEGNRIRSFGFDRTTAELVEKGGWGTGSPACLLPVVVALTPAGGTGDEGDDR